MVFRPRFGREILLNPLPFLTENNAAARFFSVALSAVLVKVRLSFASLRLQYQFGLPGSMDTRPSKIVLTPQVPCRGLSQVFDDQRKHSQLKIADFDGGCRVAISPQAVALRTSWRHREGRKLAQPGGRERFWASLGVAPQSQALNWEAPSFLHRYVPQRARA